jgi:hypothetical protein
LLDIAGYIYIEEVRWAWKPTSLGGLGWVMTLQLDGIRFFCRATTTAKARAFEVRRL